MAIIVTQVFRGTQAEKAGIAPGDRLIQLNGQDVQDILDYHYLRKERNNIFQFVSGTDNGLRTVKEKGSGPQGFDLSDEGVRPCVNKCVFCFIDQMPGGLRPTLSVKDDDPVLSLYYGNYITLTNLGRPYFEKMLRYKVSPMYISVHTTDNELRTRIMRCRPGFDIMGALREISAAGITIHTQIVLVPGWNDGDALKRTLTDLDTIGGIETVGIVPVGLTKYRDRLTSLLPVTPDLARQTLAITDAFRRGKTNTGYVWCSDEFYLLAGEPIPQDPDFYGDYQQIENGIGMVARLRENWHLNSRSILGWMKRRPWNYVVVTSASGYKAMEPIVADMVRRLPGRKVRMQAVRNRFFGESITVAGLLTAGDILDQVTLARDEMAFIPSSVFNHEDVTLDDRSPDDFARAWNGMVAVWNELLEFTKPDYCPRSIPKAPNQESK